MKTTAGPYQIAINIKTTLLGLTMPAMKNHHWILMSTRIMYWRLDTILTIPKVHQKLMRYLSSYFKLQESKASMRMKMTNLDRILKLVNNKISNNQIVTDQSLIARSRDIYKRCFTRRNSKAFILRTRPIRLFQSKLASHKLISKLTNNSRKGATSMKKD